VDKTILINIQIDGVKLAEIGLIEQLVEDCLKEYKRKQINYNITDQIGGGLPIRENSNNV